LPVSGRVQVFDKNVKFFWCEAVGASTARDTFARTNGTRCAGETVSMKDFDRCRVPTDNVVNYHIGSYCFRHVLLPLKSGICLNYGVFIALVVSGKFEIAFSIPTYQLRYIIAHFFEMWLCS
jgi:hypothetical protein